MSMDTQPRQEPSPSLANDFQHQLTREWLLANGRGGFASGTVLGINTRRYHGLLVAAARPPLERWMLLSAVLEKLTIGGQTVELANFDFDGCFHPRGFDYLVDFEVDNDPQEPCARFVYQTMLARVTKRVIVPRGKDEVWIHYTIESGTPAQVTLELAPFVPMRDFHHLTRAFDPGFAMDPCTHACIVHAWTGGPRLWMSGRNTATGEVMRFEPRSDWWRNFFYREEAHRGQDCREDLFVPGWFQTTGSGTLDIEFEAKALFRRDETAAVAGATGRGALTARPRPGPSAAVSTRNPRTAGSDVEARLLKAADAFVVTRRRVDGRESRTILAGYHWFGDWGRDTFIAMPGLLFETQRFDEAREILETFASVQRNGLIPNRFSDYGDGCDYNSVDASLWFLHAATRYFELTRDRKTWTQTLYPACRSIIEHFQKGTDFDIRVDSDGLITAGNQATQLTWMDAKFGDTVFTPRHGKAVEINALWYHALRKLEELCLENACEDAGSYDRLADRVEVSFVQSFWNSHGNYLYDVVNRPPAHRAARAVPQGHAVLSGYAGGGDESVTATAAATATGAAPQVDPAIRPNQVFAVSLPHSPLSAAQKQLVLQCVRTHLLTPYGLRSLSPRDPAYKPRCTGNPYERDSAYHQGTVWAWLMGPYVEAHLRISSFSEESKAAMRALLGYLVQHLDEAGLGYVSEIFDGDSPHTPRGCVAQAWSVAELLRAWRLTAPA